MTASLLLVSEGWPGDIALWVASSMRDMIPMLPYMKITHTLAGITKSMEYGIYLTSNMMI